MIYSNNNAQSYNDLSGVQNYNSNWKLFILARNPCAILARPQWEFARGQILKTSFREVKSWVETSPAFSRLSTHKMHIHPCLDILNITFHGLKYGEGGLMKGDGLEQRCWNQEVACHHVPPSASAKSRPNSAAAAGLAERLGMECWGFGNLVDIVDGNWNSHEKSGEVTSLTKGTWDNLSSKINMKQQN